MVLEVTITVIPRWWGVGRVWKRHRWAFGGEGTIPSLHLTAGYMRTFMW